ncbi:hypothetical protein ABT112_28765 [Streptomyces sp. NPDC002055]|uniref:hypothetical protein n=1 Tax=Streptomyces sp. NPDC002055 TaxID=3154534 RepID=UPI00332D9840
MKKIAALATVSIATAALLVGTGAPAQAADWNTRVKCEATDSSNKKIPTRFGNSVLGWNHFSRPHNIRTCRAVNAAISANAKELDDNRIEYWTDMKKGDEYVRVTVIAQYSRKTLDGEYDAGAGQKVGVITAYCKGQRQNVCPSWVN